MRRDLIDQWLELVGQWVGLRPIHSLDGEGLHAVAAAVTDRLERAGFEVERTERPGHAPLLVGRYRAAPGSFTLGIYGHYDVAEAGPGWSTPPFLVTSRDGRAWGRGLGDNLGPLALRLLTLPCARRLPNVIWVLEGEEEIGSPVGLDALSSLGHEQVDGWLDETGYFLESDRQRVLVRGRGAWIDRCLARISELVARDGRSLVTEERFLRRVAPTSGAGFAESLFGARAYLAIGPNDDHSRVHSADESVDLRLLELSARQFVAILEETADLGPAGAAPCG